MALTKTKNCWFCKLFTLHYQTSYDPNDLETVLVWTCSVCGSANSFVKEGDIYLGFKDLIKDFPADSYLVIRIDKNGKEEFLQSIPRDNILQFNEGLRLGCIFSKIQAIELVKNLKREKLTTIYIKNVHEYNPNHI